MLHHAAALKGEAHSLLQIVAGVRIREGMQWIEPNRRAAICNVDAANAPRQAGRSIARNYRSSNIILIPQIEATFYGDQMD